MVAVATVFVWRNVKPSGPDVTDVRPPSAVSPIDDELWRRALSLAPPASNTAAPAKLLIFSDFECPSCRAFHSTTRALQERFGDSLAVHLLHVPLTSHRFAAWAALSAKCAAEQGRHSAMEDALYSAQDSLGLKSWTEIASVAGVPDTSVFRSCVATGKAPPIVDETRSLGLKISIKGTPTVMYNGWIFDSPPGKAHGILPRLDKPVQSLRQQHHDILL